MKSRKSFNYARFGYIFSIPFVIAWLIFQLYPILFTFFIAFTDLQGAGNLHPHLLWPGLLSNFTSLLDNSMFRKAFGNTALMWILNFVPQMALALLVAAWFTDNRQLVKGQGIFKILFYMPNIITAATIGILFASLFGFPKGPVNDIADKLGILKFLYTKGLVSEAKIAINEVNGKMTYAYNFPISKQWARGIVIFIQTWMWYGYTAIVLISGILGISPELFEAAEVDGANRFQKFWRITIPNIKTIMLYTLVTSLIGGLQMFDIPQVFLAGKPDNSTMTAAMFIYNQAFGPKAMYNRAAAASILIFIIICILSAIMFYMLRDKDEAELRKIVREQEKRYKAQLKLEQQMKKGGK